MRAVAGCRDPDGRGVGRATGGDGEKVAQHLHDTRAVGQQARQVPRWVADDRAGGAAVQRCDARLLHQCPQLGRRGRDRDRVCLDAEHIQQVGDEAPNVVGLLVDDP